MRSVLTLFLAALLPLALTAELEIEYLTPDVECKYKTEKGDTVSVHYAGKLQSNDEQFDSSYGRGRPLDFELGVGRVIKGWDQGLLNMCPGEKRRLTIPPELGYGSRAMGPIPANSVLIFDTELVSIKGKDEL